VKPELVELEKFVATNREFRLAIKRHNIASLSLSRILRGRSIKAVVNQLPELKSTKALARWLGIRVCDLEWLANLVPARFETLDSTPGLSKHYVCTLIRKRKSGWRLIESPKPILKAAQRQVHLGLLSKMEPHDSAHGFRRGRSIVSFVQPHVGKSVCLKMDLKDFFPAISFGRVWGLFRSVGYCAEVSRYLAAICTCSTGFSEIVDAALAGGSIRKDLGRVYQRRHLPQGAPTSPCLANLIAYSLDARISGLAASAEFSYTRYADDLLFSGGIELAKSAKRFESTVGAIAIEEGFEVQFRKTRLMRKSQRQLATGLVLNQSPNVPRREYELLKATLFNCVRFGPESQNRDGETDFRRHLEGRIAWVGSLNLSRAGKLERLFQDIDWQQ